MIHLDQISPNILPEHLGDLDGASLNSAVPALRQLLKNRSVEVRLAAVGALARTPYGTDSLRSALSSERNEVVLSEACEALGLAQDGEAVHALKTLAEDHPSSLVRSYALLAVAEISGSSAASFLIERLRNVRGWREGASLDYALILAGVWNRLDALLGKLASRDYIVRCRVGNYLSNEIFRKHRDRILPLLDEAIGTDGSLAAREALERAREILVGP